MQKAPVVFLQYLAALAIVEGIHSYDYETPTAYKKLPVKLKWPNDICESVFHAGDATNAAHRCSRPHST